MEGILSNDLSVTSSSKLCSMWSSLSEKRSVKALSSNFSIRLSSNFNFSRLGKFRKVSRRIWEIPFLVSIKVSRLSRSRNDSSSWGQFYQHLVRRIVRKKLDCFTKCEECVKAVYLCCHKKIGSNFYQFNDWVVVQTKPDQGWKISKCSFLDHGQMVVAQVEVFQFRHVSEGAADLHDGVVRHVQSGKVSQSVEGVSW